MYVMYSMYVYLHMYVRMYVCMLYICVYIYMCVCMCVCMYVCIMYVCLTLPRLINASIDNSEHYYNNDY